MRHSRYRGGGRRYGDWSGAEWAAWHDRQRDYLSKRCFGLDAEVTRLFYSLSRSQLSALFKIYGQTYGPSPKAYAEKTYPSWKLGVVTPSAVTLARLLQVVPAVIPLAEKAALVAHLRRRTRTQQQAKVTCRLGEVGLVVPKLLVAHFRAGLTHEIPGYLRDALQWLSEDSVKAAEELLKLGEAVEAEWLMAAGAAEVERIREAARRGFAIEGRLTRSFSHHISTPYAALVVTVTPDDASSSAPDGRALTGVGPMSDITPARKDDLLAELTSGLSEAERNELKKVAAREQLSLDAKAREAQLRHAASGAELDRAIDAAERLQYGDKSSSFAVNGSFQGASGSTHLEVRRSESLSLVLKWVGIVGVVAGIVYLIAK